MVNKQTNTVRFNDLPDGSVVKYRHKIYWLAKGLDGRIVIDQNAVWTFIRDLKWKFFTVLFIPGK